MSEILLLCILAIVAVHLLLDVLRWAARHQRVAHWRQQRARRKLARKRGQ